MELFSNIYKAKKVLITGHTGFKGSWLAFWLLKMGADVVGYSLKPPTSPNHFDLLKLPMHSIIGDIRDRDKLFKAFQNSQPEITFHMAAQPLVRLSYQQPFETYETNVMGLVNVLEACRNTPSLRVVVNITSDKCYQNNEWVWGYRENDPMGGYDPYSSSKGCAELITAAYRNSFFNIDQYNQSHQILLASARAGNVIGGGDWAEDRLIPDIIRAMQKNSEVIIRKPQSTRPWQHVLEPLSGYLLLGQKLLQGEKAFAEAWNFGPKDEDAIPVIDIVKKLKSNWAKVNYRVEEDKSDFHEAHLLKLDCSKAHAILKWQGIWDNETTFKKTTEWYKAYYEKDIIRTDQDLKTYINDAVQSKTAWAQ
ncbi:MAG: CDP-glucose 4,6-dehydratase [Desulfobacteraceae bacterium]|nr:CDP-glucose 4,6-dehydratase [Desulfobacteraceae bacterium]MBU3913893.1 CDP-glucose 4,6-dehydratase [Nanoarchaeota archaeon]MBU4037723.1 CDP-glucose 4,6-dehydratase [Pseudomonadota bacterium]